MFFDTAEIYSPNLAGIGHNERFVGKVLRLKRGRLALASRRLEKRRKRRKRYNGLISNKNPAILSSVLWKVSIDLAEISGYNNFEVIYLWGMAFAFPANIKRRLWLWIQR